MNLKNFRTDFKLSQRDLADLFGCKQANISNIENGVRKITRSQLKCLINKYSLERIKPYLEEDDSLPAATVNADIFQTNIEGNNSQIQNGDGNSITADAALVQVVKQQSDQISRLLDQQDRLISLLEKSR